MMAAPAVEDFHCPACGRIWIAVFPNGREVDTIECKGCWQFTGVPR